MLNTYRVRGLISQAHTSQELTLVTQRPIASLVLKGELAFERLLRVDGRFEGELKSEVFILFRMSRTQTDPCLSCTRARTRETRMNRPARPLACLLARPPRRNPPN